MLVKVQVRHETLYEYKRRLMPALFWPKVQSFEVGGSPLAHNRRPDRREVAEVEAEHFVMEPVHASRMGVARGDQGSLGRRRLNSQRG